MIGSLRGRILESNDESIIIDVGGVGYEVIPSSGARAIPSGDGREVTLSIFTDVRENAISLFGFASRAEREVFLLLKRVKGVGSKHALGVVSTLRPEEVLRAIATEDIVVLQTVQGIGKRTAERIVVELRERVAEMVGSVSQVSESARVEPGSPLARSIEVGRDVPAERDTILALEKLGFSRVRAQQAVRSAVETKPELGKSTEDLLRTALLHL